MKSAAFRDNVWFPRVKAAAVDVTSRHVTSRHVTTPAGKEKSDPHLSRSLPLGPVNSNTGQQVHGFCTLTRSELRGKGNREVGLCDAVNSLDTV